MMCIFVVLYLYNKFTEVDFMIFNNIPSYNWENIQKNVKSLSKYGCSVFLKDISTYKGNEVISIDLNIPQVLEGGKWQFLGLKKICGDDVLYFGNVPTKYHNTSMYCEHCSSNRGRTSVIIIRDLDTNTIKQVGKTCIKKYLGNGFRLLGNLLLTIDDILEDDYSDEYYSIACNYVNLNKYLYCCMKSIKDRGYIKKYTVDDNGNDVMTTAHDAMILYDSVHDIDSVEVEKAIQVYKEFVLSKGDNSDFTHNVLTLLSNSYIEREYINMVAFVPTFLLNKYRFEAEKKASKSKLSNKYIGNVGDKVSAKVRLIHYKYYETHFTYRGETNCLYTFIDNEGSLIQWNTQKSIGYDLDRAIENKTQFTITGTVKACKEFKNRFYTVLTRCRIA